MVYYTEVLGFYLPFWKTGPKKLRNERVKKDGLIGKEALIEVGSYFSSYIFEEIHVLMFQTLILHQ